LSTIKVNNIQSRTGNAISFTSGDTITIPSGATLTNNGTANFGKVAQVLHTTTTTELVLTSSAYTDLGLEQAITPSSTSSKILIFTNIHSQYQDSGQNASYTMKMLRGATQVYTGGQLYEITSETANATGQQKDSWTFLDSPSTTSSTTYKVQVSTFNNSDVTFQRGGFFQSELLLMEILV